MNDAYHAAYQQYLRDLADRLLLRDWEIALSREWPQDPLAYAAVVVCREDNQAVIYLQDGFLGHPAEDRRKWLTHELMHVHLDRPQRVMERLGEQFPDNTATVFAKQMHHDEIEISVCRLVRILAPTLPLPPEVAVE